MKLYVLRALAIAAAIFCLLTPRPAIAQLGMNFLADPGAEGPPPPPAKDWKFQGDSGTLGYAQLAGLPLFSDPGPVGRGHFYFAGGQNGTAQETISLQKGNFHIIDIGKATITLSGYLGPITKGFATVTVVCLDEVGDRLGSFTIGTGSTATNTAGIRGLGLKTLTVGVPKLTRRFQVTIQFSGAGDQYGVSGYADNLSLVLNSTGERFDVDGTGTDDLLYQNITTRQLGVQLITRGQPTSFVPITQIPAAGFSVVGVGDFNADGFPDILLQSKTTGQLVVWYMNGTTVTSGATLTETLPANYHIVSVADMNSDGYPDLVLQNSVTRQVMVWYFAGTQMIAGDTLDAIPAVGSQIVGTSDINGDGNNDLVFQNSTTRAISFWYLSGGEMAGSGSISTIPAVGAAVHSVGDVQSLGLPSVVFQNTTSGVVSVWNLLGASIDTIDTLTTQPPAGYQLAGPR